MESGCEEVTTNYYVISCPLLIPIQLRPCSVIPISCGLDGIGKNYKRI
jgi:hypothetical protein